MNAFENATQFFHACESSQGWGACEEFVVADAVFSGQADSLSRVKTVKAYCKWMEFEGKGPLVGAKYELHNSVYDESKRTAIFFATYIASHVGEGGPVPPTHKETNSEFVYILNMSPEGKIEKMCKVWNDVWSSKELGWI